MNFKNRILRSLASGGSLWPEAAEFNPALEFEANLDRNPKVLLVVAHPDDESECAATVYRITHELAGTVDQVIVTNGEAGFQHAVPAQEYYRLPLAREEVGRKHLPKIRRKEVLRASRILGVRDTYFFNQKDTGFTLDPQIGFRNWDVQQVQAKLVALLAREEYDLVLTLLPAAGTHGHHQTVAILLLHAVAELPPEQRPAVLGVKTAASEIDPPPLFDAMPGVPRTRTFTREPTWCFNRRTRIDGGSALDYTIVVNWVIAEHKSQGLFQMEIGRNHLECFWLFEISGAQGRSRWDNFLGTIGLRSIGLEPIAGQPELTDGPPQQGERVTPARGLRGRAYARVGI
jgi:LmbE family N-acetylglucosaminyl deacetylase